MQPARAALSRYRRWAALVAVCGGLAGLAGCSGVGTLNALTVRHSESVQTDVPYGELARQRLDVYRPAAAAPAGGWPVVVFFYGGTWTSGSRSDYRFLGEALASHGVLTVVADYRLYPEVRFPDFLHDSARALSWGLEHAQALGGNPRRVFVMGHSAGGYNAAMLALDPRWLQATGHAPSELAGFIGLAGPYDFLPTDNPDAQRVFHHPDYPPRAQPIEFVHAGAPRTFLGAPERDQVVSFERSTVQLADKLRASGVDVTLRPYPRASHITLMGAFAWPLRPVAPVLDDVTAFIHSTPSTPLRP